MGGAGQRLKDFLGWRGWSQSDLAREAECHQTYVSKIIGGFRAPNRRVAHAIERLTKIPHELEPGRSETWAHGPIRTEEWDGVGETPDDEPTPIAPPAKARPRPAARRAAGGAR